jgi:uncharacterized protein
MPGRASPREVVERLLDGISNGHWRELHRLYGEDAVIEYPFGLPAPRRLEGLPAIRRYFDTVAKLPLELRARNVSVHETGDAEVVVVEYDYDGLATASGRSFEVSNIQVSRVRDGLIVSSRDYHNHVMLADVLDQLTDLISATTNR